MYVAQWMHDFPQFCADVLRVVDKQGEVVPLRLNPVQLELHHALEAQRAAEGRVRAVVLKARQMGLSTLVAARFYWRMMLSGDPLKIYLLTHREDAAKNIVNMVNRFLVYAPHDSLRPKTLASNTMEVRLANDSVYEGHTASVASSGRSGTVHGFHSSETAFQAHAAEHILGTMQQVPKQGSEVILESTACGPSGSFFEQFRSARQGGSDFEAHFFPWFRLPEYQMEVPYGFELNPQPPNDYTLSEHEYQDKYGLSLQQMAWRRWKLQELAEGGYEPYAGFAQEYPADEDEAFGRGVTDSFLSPRHVAAAIARQGALRQEHFAYGIVIGVDPAPAHGGSATAIAYRRGPVCFRIHRLRGMETQAQAEWLLAEYQRLQPAAMCIDTSEGTGNSIAEFLLRMGCRVHRVQFGSSARRPERFKNRRAEMWHAIGVWLADGGSLPLESQGEHRVDLRSELLSVKRNDANESMLQLEPKANVIKRTGVSPDGADALACTFAIGEPVANAAPGDEFSPFGGGVVVARGPRL